MNRDDWLKGRELADPDTTVVVHIVGWTHHWLGLIMPGTLCALCGDNLAREDDSAGPTPDSPVCEDCARRIHPARRLLNAYYGLWLRYPAVTLAAVLALTIGSGAWFVASALLLSPWAPLAAVVFAVALVLYRFAPGDDDENGDDS